MASRQIATAKHVAIARLLVDGTSGYRALLQCGYTHYSARNPGLVIKHCRALRQAIAEEQERRREYLVPRPARRRRDRFSRRAVANLARTYCGPEFQTPYGNSAIRQYDKVARKVERIAAGLPPKVDEPKRLTRCPSCGAMVDERKMFLNFSQTMSVCPRCAGVDPH